MNASDEATRSLWMHQDVAPDAPRLQGRLRCDTVIVGSGIAGLSVAYELASGGQEGHRGRPRQHRRRNDLAHHRRISRRSATTASARSPACAARKPPGFSSRARRRRSIGSKQIVKEHDIACNFRRLDAFLFPALGMEPGEARKQQDEEYKALRKAGADVERVKGVPLKGFEDAPAIRYARQATFHPLKYLRGVVAAIEEKGGLLFANSAVTEIEELEDGVRVTTDGGSITAAHAVFATNSPINDRVALHSKMAPYRTYAMAFTVPRGTLPDALYWDMADPYHYVRLNPGPGTTDYLIVGGADHKSGEADDGDVRFEAIEAWIRSLVPQLGKEVHRWSGQVLDTIDYCGFIGRNPGSENVYVVDRRFRPRHDARRARRDSAQGPDADRTEPLGRRSTIRRARRPAAS